ncbi:hypothetical protein [Candidatus Enterovibrio escicola]|uniref:hypothetical protein n=1 Tax=Candidatus Enterovibrio escicola TaxID=1927127 RepID=UPI0016814C22|nr:hypothetical protein [Candidatus Enterovibrio escacola]
MNNLDAIFVDVDDFCQTFLPAWKKYLISSLVSSSLTLQLIIQGSIACFFARRTFRFR